MDKFKEIKDRISMANLCEIYEVPITNNRGACPIHKGTNKESFRIVPNGLGFICASCDAKGDIFDFVMKMDGLSKRDAFTKLEKLAGIQPMDVRKESSRPSMKWQYNDKGGNLLFEIHRFERGNGKVCKPYCDGKYGLTDDKRILYNADLLTSSPDAPVFITEGEKASDVVSSFGYLSTCNPMGSKQWKKEYGYAELLKDREIIIMPDADEPSEKWRESIINDLRGKVKSIRTIRIPDEFVTCHKQFKGHDIADVCEIDPNQAIQIIIEGLNNDEVLNHGIESDLITTPSDAFDELVQLHSAGEFEVIDFSKWIPSLNVMAHRGDMVCIMAQTGVGKTRLIHNIPFFIDNINYDLFDLELSRGILGLRYASMASGKKTRDILSAIRKGYELPKINLDHILINNGGNIDIEHIRDRVHMHEDVLQKKIHVVGIDYIGLMKKAGASRYQELSAHVEGFKGFLTEEGRTGLITTQVSRPYDKEEGYFQCPSLFDGKDSGSVENSSQVVFAVWRTDMEDRSKLAMKVLKYSHGAEFNTDEISITANGLLVGDRIRMQERIEKQATFD